MFVKNTTDKDIPFRSFEGYKFLIPPGVSWIYDPAGEWLLSKVYVTPKTPSVDKFGTPNGNGVQPLQAATKAEWVKGGKRLAQVQRFTVNYTQIPKREQMIAIANKRGISKERIQEYMVDATIEREQIAQEINSLPIPESIRYPKELEEETQQNQTNQPVTV